MDPDVGDGVPPDVGLTLQVAKIGKGSERPEVVADVVDNSFFDLSFFLWCSDIARPGNGLELAEEVEESAVVADNRAVPLDDRGEHVVVDQFPRGATEKKEGVPQAAVQGLLALAVAELEIEHPAVAFGDRQTGELPGGIAVVDSAEMAPVDLALLAGCGLEADKGPLFFRPHRGQVIAEDGDLAGKTFALETLQDDGGGGAGVTVEQLTDLFPKRVEQTLAYHLFTLLLRVGKVFGDGFPVQSQQCSDSGFGVALIGVVVNGKNDAFIKHGRLAVSW